MTKTTRILYIPLKARSHDAIFCECDCFLYRMQWVVWMSVILFRRCDCVAFLRAMSNVRHRISMGSIGPILCDCDFDSKITQSHIGLCEWALRFVHTMRCATVFFKAHSHSVMWNCVF